MLYDWPKQLPFMPTQPTPEAQADFSALLDALMPFAEQMLKKHGEFFPFGAAVSTSGEVSAHAADLGDESPSPEDVIARLVQAFQGEASGGAIRASGICFNGLVVEDGKKVDAVIVNLEHVSGCASKACIPWSKGMFGKVRFGEMSVAFDDPKIFGAA
jgi:hypothetical protein